MNYIFHQKGEIFSFNYALIKLESAKKLKLSLFIEGKIMKKAAVVSVLFVLTAGCTSSLDGVRTANRRNLLKLSAGMTKERAVKVMGHKSGGGSFGEPTANSPYKSEIIQRQGKTFEVLYYYTDVRNAIYVANPATINDDELTPLVFDNGKLIGWGADFLENIKKDKAGDR